MVVPVLNKAFS